MSSHPKRLSDGDVIITNDPWIGTGHSSRFKHGASRFSTATGSSPIPATVSHLPDIGGRIRSPDAREGV